MSKTFEYKILTHSPDKQRVVVWLTRSGRTDKYLVVAGTKTLVWTRTRGRSYIISADKCNCPASRGRCKHALVTVELKALGFFKAEKWEKWVSPLERKGTAIYRMSPDARNLFPEEHWGQGWCTKTGRTVAVLRHGLTIPNGWWECVDPAEQDFAHRCFRDMLAKS